MARASSYHHRIKPFPEWGFYRLSWRVDYYYADSMLRYPRGFSRDTDEAGARRFAKRHGIEFPAPK